MVPFLAPDAAMEKWKL